jgi:hypothetical protein
MDEIEKRSSVHEREREALRLQVLSSQNRDERIFCYYPENQSFLRGRNMVYNMASARFLASHGVTRRQRLLVNRYGGLCKIFIN